MSLKSTLPSLWSDDEKRVDPFTSLHDEINRVFGAFERQPLFPAINREGMKWTPKTDVSETDGEITISAELPDVDQKDVHVELADDVLTISGEKKSDREEKGEEKGRKFHRVERSYGSFQRSMRVPAGIDPDQVEAAFKDGVLTVTLQKPPELQEKTRKIEVKSAS